MRIPQLFPALRAQTFGVLHAVVVFCGGQPSGTVAPWSKHGLFLLSGSQSVRLIETRIFHRLSLDEDANRRAGPLRSSPPVCLDKWSAAPGYRCGWVAKVRGELA